MIAVPVRRPRRLKFALALVVAHAASGRLTPAAQVRRPSGRPAAPPATRHPAFKAVFEPVPYRADVDVGDVFFVSAQIGWACGQRRHETGDGGFIIGTRDGGHTWSLQHGSPDAATRAITRLFFVDATHGWAVQADGTLLRTTDGAAWASVGGVEAPRPFVFVSPRKGVRLDGGRGLQTTADGGRTWQPSYRCQTAADVTGRTRDQECEPEAIAFAPDRLTGYVVAGTLDHRAAAVLITSDGGDTWTPRSIIPDVDATGASLVFRDARTGYLRTGRSLRMTADGGSSWHVIDAVVPDGAPAILFSGAFGWMVGGNTFSYTRDAGKRWNTRTIEFPAAVIQSTLPDPGHGYVVGGRGLLYHFHVVPFDFNVPGMLAVPSMSGMIPDS